MVCRASWVITDPMLITLPLPRAAMPAVGRRPWIAARRPALRPRVVHQHIGRRMGVEQLIAPLLGGGGVGDVEAHRGCGAGVPAGLPDGGARLGQCVLVASVHHHGGAVLGQALGQGQAQPAGGSGHQGEFSGQVEHAHRGTSSRGRGWVRPDLPHSLRTERSYLFSCGLGLAWWYPPPAGTEQHWEGPWQRRCYTVTSSTPSEPRSPMARSRAGTCSPWPVWNDASVSRAPWCERRCASWSRSAWCMPNGVWA